MAARIPVNWLFFIKPALSQLQRRLNRHVQGRLARASRYRIAVHIALRHDAKARLPHA
jgi:hypothetical protein